MNKSVKIAEYKRLIKEAEILKEVSKQQTELFTRYIYSIKQTLSELQIQNPPVQRGKKSDFSTKELIELKGSLTKYYPKPKLEGNEKS